VYSRQVLTQLLALNHVTPLMYFTVRLKIHSLTNRYTRFERAWNKGTNAYLLYKPTGNPAYFNEWIKWITFLDGPSLITIGLNFFSKASNLFWLWISRSSCNAAQTHSKGLAKYAERQILHLNSRDKKLLLCLIQLLLQSFIPYICKLMNLKCSDKRIILSFLK